MNWNVRIAKRVLKGIKRFSKKDARRLLFILEKLTDDPYQGDIRKIRGEDNIWRKRIGSYRILYEIASKKKHIYVFQVQRKTTPTYRKKR